MNASFQTWMVGYLAEVRARGYQLCGHEEAIKAFLNDIEKRNITTITITDALLFANRPGTTQTWQAARLRAITRFAGYVHSFDPTAAELIPPKLITTKTIRSIPYLYTAEQIENLMGAAAALSAPVLADSMHLLIGLCAATGMRSGEVFGLNVGDVSDDNTVLTVIGKNTKQRLIVLHPTVTEALHTYLIRRAATATTTDAVLLGTKGGRLNSTTARLVFRTIVDRCKLELRPGCGVARLHDFRHTFAVNTLIDAHRDGVDIDARIAVLSTYLGHTNPANTYWYLTASPELMAIVSDRMAAWQHRTRT